MRKNEAGYGMSVVLGGAFMLLAMGMVSLITLVDTDHQPDIPALSQKVVVPSTHATTPACVQYAVLFEQALEKMPVQQWADQWSLVQAINRVFLDSLYSDALKQHPEFECAIAFLREKGGSIPVEVAPRVIVHFYNVQWWERELVGIGGRL